VAKTGTALTRLKLVGVLLCALVLASHLLSMMHWTEERGVNDDFCYLRQAHLFQSYGLGGFDTSTSRDDGYLARKLPSLPGYSSAMIPPCHTPMAAQNKYVIQYPPGTGLLLALFPSGHQVVPLFALCTILIFALAVGAIRSTTSMGELAVATVFGCLAVYVMINPVKASYSMAPTMVASAIAGLLTARLVTGRTRHELLLTAATGLVLGLSVNFRLANLFLSSGYLLYFLMAWLGKRSLQTFRQGLAFGLALVVGMVPTLISNTINAGSPFSTTYGPGDAVPPKLDLDVVQSYVLDLQFMLILAAIVWTALAWRRGARDLAILVATNLAINIAFFVTHPVFTPYYTLPIAALSLWSLLFGTIGQSAERRTLDLKQAVAA
jgi:hypothetical protein